MDTVVVRTNLRPPTVVAHAFGSETLSPDGSRLAVASPGALVIVDAAGKHALRVSRRTAAMVRWSPDGRRVAFDDGGGVWVVGRRGGRVSRVSAVATGSFAWLGSHVVLQRSVLGTDAAEAWMTPSPDGRWIAFARSCAPRRSGSLLTDCRAAVLDTTTRGIAGLGAIVERDTFPAFAWAGAHVLFMRRAALVSADPASHRAHVLREEPGPIVGAGADGSFAFWPGRSYIRVCRPDGSVIANVRVPDDSSQWQVAFPG